MVVFAIVLELIKFKVRWVQENNVALIASYSLILFSMKPLVSIELKEGGLEILRELRLFAIVAVPFVCREWRLRIIALAIAIFNESHSILVLDQKIS
jgi:hypothetical protein